MLPSSANSNNSNQNPSTLSTARIHSNTDCSITDDSDSDSKSNVNYKERRREAHTQAEQKRRDAIKRGYEDLQYLVPSCQQQDSVSSYKLSKATILQRSIDYIQTLQSQQKKQKEELQRLRKEVVALQIVQKTYQKLVNNQQNQAGHQSNQISEETKFQVFQAICDNLFQSFDSSVNCNDFNEISACIFSWTEENCKPSTLRNLTNNILNHVKNQSPPN